MNTKFAFKNILSALLQWIGASVGFVVCLIIDNLLLPLPKALMAAVPASGFLPTFPAFMLNAGVNALVLVWAARRSSSKGFGMWMQLLVLSFGAQTFMTQVETGYFISAFPLLHGNFVIYQLVLRGLVTSVLFALLVTWMAGGFSKKPRPQPMFIVPASDIIKTGAWLALIYIALYMLFGYYVAWQSQELRLFYGGPAELNSFTAQWGLSLMEHPELPVFQYFRGMLWILCLVPLFMGFTGKRVELVILSALALGLLPTAQLAFANPLMPAGVSLYHFIEVSISTGIFGAFCGWFVPKTVQASNLGALTPTDSLQPV
jgi:hypothetical protein